jgi:Ca2+-transporting ATPase
MSPRTNPFLLASVVGALAIHAAALYLPPTQFILRVEPIDLEAWARIILVASTLVVAMEIHKAVRRRWPYGGRSAELATSARPEVAGA